MCTEAFESSAECKYLQLHAALHKIRFNLSSRQKNNVINESTYSVKFACSKNPDRTEKMSSKAGLFWFPDSGRSPRSAHPVTLDMQP